MGFISRPWLLGGVERFGGETKDAMRVTSSDVAGSETTCVNTYAYMQLECVKYEEECLMLAELRKLVDSGSSTTRPSETTVKMF